VKLTRLLVFAAVVMFLPLVALAQDNVVIGDTDGTFTYNQMNQVLDLGITCDGGGHPDPGMLTSLTGLSVFGVSNQFGADLGSLTLTTGTLMTGTVGTTSGSATFNAGGSFKAAFLDGVVFKGQFSSASWTEVGTDTWVFSGVIMDGTLKIPLSGGGFMTIDNINGATVQLTTIDAAGVQHGTPGHGRITFKDSGGNSNFAVAPEPGTLTLFGSGLIAVGMLTRRQLAARSASSRSS